MPTPQRRNVEVFHRTFRLLDAGGDAPPIILLHGVTRRGDDFLPLWPHLAALHRPVAVDQRGHGRSGRTPGAYRVVDYVPDIVALLRQHIKVPAIILGHSLGGMVAAAAAAEAPELVRGLVLEDPTFEMTGARIGETPFPDLFRAFRARAGSDRPESAIAADLARAPIHQADQTLPVPLGSLRDGASLRYTAACLKRLDPEVLDVPLAGRWIDGYDVAGTLRRIACPTLFLQADPLAGGALPDLYAADLAGAIADVVFIKTPGVGHNIHGAAADSMLRAVLPFLASLD